MKIRPASAPSLAHAMAKVAEIHSRPQLIAYLQEHFDFWEVTEENVTIEKYGYDTRIGWDTYLISIDGKAALFADGDSFVP